MVLPVKVTAFCCANLITKRSIFKNKYVMNDINKRNYDKGNIINIPNSSSKML